MSAGARRPTALIIGGARRVGAAICRELSRAGCDMVFTYHTSEAEAAALEAELNGTDAGGGAGGSGGGRGSPGPASEMRATKEMRATTEMRATKDMRATTVRLEMHEPGRLAAQIAEIALQREAWDVLVICASVYKPCSLAEFTPERAQADYQVNAVAPAMICQAMAAKLGASTFPGGGSIVMMGDIHAMGPGGRPRRGFMTYSMSKCAMTGLALVLSRELAPRVRVNVVAPGVVAFPETGPEADEGMRARYLARVPLRRSGTPQDAAVAVRFLALEALYTTGQVLRVDGGEGA